MWEVIRFLYAEDNTLMQIHQQLTSHAPQHGKTTHRLVDPTVVPVVWTWDAAAPSDFHVFRPFKRHLAGQQFVNNNDDDTTVMIISLQAFEHDSYANGFNAMVSS
jgi:hypothetical protein